MLEQEIPHHGCRAREARALVDHEMITLDQLQPLGLAGALEGLRVAGRGDPDRQLGLDRPRHRAQRDAVAERVAGIEGFATPTGIVKRPA